MPEQLTNILWSVVGVVVTGLASYVVVLITNFINSKIKDQKLAALATSLVNIVLDSVKLVYQTSVETLKTEGLFNKEAQEKAKNQALDIIKGKLTPELEAYVLTQGPDLEIYLSDMIEAQLYNLKNKK